MLCPPLRTVLPSTPNFTGLVAAPSMHKLTSLSKFGGRWQHHQCTSSHRFQSLEEGRHQLADQPDAVHQLALDEHSQPSEKGEWVYLSRTNYIEWISFTRLTWTRSEAAETARPHTSNLLLLHQAQHRQLVQQILRSLSSHQQHLFQGLCEQT